MIVATVMTNPEPQGPTPTPEVRTELRIAGAVRLRAEVLSDAVMSDRFLASLHGAPRATKHLHNLRGAYACGYHDYGLGLETTDSPYLELDRTYEFWLLGWTAAEAGLPAEIPAAPAEPTQTD